MSKRKLVLDDFDRTERQRFLDNHKSVAREFLDLLEMITCNEPELGESVGPRQLQLTRVLELRRTYFKCDAVYIYNDTHVKWLKCTWEVFKKPVT